MVSNHFFRKSLSTLFISCIFFVLGSFVVFAEGGETEIDYIAVNNEIVEGEEVTVVKDDVIKIAGRGTIDDQVSISVNGNKYETKVDTTGNWFVLFSINDAQYGEYPVNVYTNDSDKYKEFAKLKINVPTDIEQVEEQNILTNKRFGSLEIMLLSILGLVVVGVPIIILILKKKNEKKKK